MPAHTFSATGTFQVTLTVTDNASSTGTVTTAVGVTAANVPPTAAFTYSCSLLTCSVDGTTSSDPEGPIASYGWDFGDGTTGAGPTVSHAYAATGSYPVTLAVTDDVDQQDGQRLLRPAVVRRRRIQPGDQQLMGRR